MEQIQPNQLNNVEPIKPEVNPGSLSKSVKKVLEIVGQDATETGIDLFNHLDKLDGVKNRQKSFDPLAVLNQ